MIDTLGFYKTEVIHLYNTVVFHLRILLGVNINFSVKSKSLKVLKFPLFLIISLVL